jgi:hypothetical protein
MPTSAAVAASFSWAIVWSWIRCSATRSTAGSFARSRARRLETISNVLLCVAWATNVAASTGAGAGAGRAAGGGECLTWSYLPPCRRRPAAA